MDNVTHSLIGYALARAATRTRSSAEQRAGIWASIAASNAPDLDFLVRLTSHNAQLNYLANHRGHTHTLLFAIPLGIACAELFLRAFGASRETGARARSYLLAAVAALLHIGFDWLNNYGVHPFYPLDNHWYYGDAVFIIEPLLFAALVPLLLFQGLTRVGRVTGGVVMATVLGIVWGVSLVPFSSALIATIGFADMLLVSFIVAKRRPHKLAWATVANTVAVVAAFGVGQAVARDTFEKHLSERVPSERIAQLVLTPSPSNPLCWSALAITLDPEGTYRARFGFTSLAPPFIAPATCRLMPRGPTTAPLRASTLPPVRLETVSAVIFDLVYEGKLEHLRALAKKSCEARVLLQFARAPYWIEGPPTIVGDLRFDHEAELSFADLEPHGACSDGPVPWVPPLQSLLD